ncbi:MAG: hypothetical protein NZ529_10475, partial [Cytophagaceae bacterium]|nr:hypothetical protein [Cytophagaceae bacterium]MDW8457211.1 hypothetical protein [Cytophagaceae bacterium]
MKYKTLYGCKILVETGTYKGDMIEAQLNNFDEIISIELSLELWEKAKNRFKYHSKVNLIQGDSGKELQNVCTNLKDRTLFWLDGHYCGGNSTKGDLECPIYNELKAIFKSPIKHVILIDDARYFIGKRDYPTIKELKNFRIRHLSDNHFICSRRVCDHFSHQVLEDALFHQVPVVAVTVLVQVV